MAYTWTEFTEYLDGSRLITSAERNELWDALADLLTRCGGRWQLVEEEMTAFKETGMEGDLTVVEDTEPPEDEEEEEGEEGEEEEGEDEEPAVVAGDLAAIIITVQDMFTGQTGYEAFKAVAPAEGLSEDDLAEFITDTGRATPCASHHIWNLYKRVLDYLSCCPLVLPSVRSELITASKRGYGFVPFDQLSDTGIYPSVPVEEILTLFARKVDNFTASYYYAGFIFGNINPIFDGPCAGCCVRYDVDNEWSAEAVLTSDFGGFGDSYSQTRTPDFSTPAGSYSTSNTVTGQEGCNPACDDAVEDEGDADFGGDSLGYYSFQPGDVTGPTARAGSSSQTTGGLTGGADCANTAPKVLPGTMDREGSSELSNPLTREDTIEAAKDDLGDWPGTWGGGGTVTRTTAGMGLYGLFVPGSAFIDAGVYQGRWEAAIPSSLVEGRTYHLIYRYNYTPIGGELVEGDEQTLEIVPDGEASWTATEVVPWPEFPGAMELELLRWECPE